MAISKCYRCGKTIVSLNSYEIGIANFGNVYSRKFVLCEECKQAAKENFEKFIDQKDIFNLKAESAAETIGKPLMNGVQNALNNKEDKKMSTIRVRCHKCGKPTEDLEYYKIRLANEAADLSDEYVVCSDCQDKITQEFAKYMETLPEENK